MSGPGVAPPLPRGARGWVRASWVLHLSESKFHALVEPWGCVRKRRLADGSPFSESISLGRRIRVVLEWCGSDGCYAGCPCWAIWVTSALPALCLPPPAPLRRAAAASDWEPGSFRRVPVRVEDVGCSLVDSWAPSGALSAPRVLFGEAPLVGQCPLGELEAPVPSRAFAARRAGSGLSR